MVSSCCPPRNRQQSVLYTHTCYCWYLWWCSFWPGSALHLFASLPPSEAVSSARFGSFWTRFYTPRFVLESRLVCFLCRGFPLVICGSKSNQCFPSISVCIVILGKDTLPAHNHWLSSTKYDGAVFHCGCSNICRPVFPSLIVDSDTFSCRRYEAFRAREARRRKAKAYILRLTKIMRGCFSPPASVPRDPRHTVGRVLPESAFRFSTCSVMPHVVYASATLGH